MRMDEMDECLRNWGFDVSRTYNSRQAGYTFIIKKDGIMVDGFFKYPLDDKNRNYLQNDFMKRLIDDWLHIAGQVKSADARYSNSKTDRRIIPTIEKVIYNGPATIVMWGDGTKTIVKCTENDTFDPEKGLAMAISKKALGSDFKEVKKWANTYGEPFEIVFDIEIPKTGSMAQAISESLDKLNKARKRRRGDLSL